MDLETAKEAIEYIAKKEGVSVEEVRLEMRNTIKKAYDNPKTHQEWAEIFGDRAFPTPEEFISIVSKKVNDNRNNAV